MNLALTWAEGSVLGSRGLRAWASSLSTHSPEAKIVVLSSAPVNVPGVENVVYQSLEGGIPLHRRWAAYTRYLASVTEKVTVLLSDCRDLVFQDDPFVGADSNFIVVSEYQKTGGHPWTKDKAVSLQQKTKLTQDLTREEINGGVQLGPLDSILLFCAAMDMGMYCGVDTDQALLNWWFYNRCPVPWKFAPAGWYIHGESVKLNKQRMEIVDGKACVDGKVAAVWHQYDRTGHTVFCQRKPKKDISETDLLVLVSHFKENLDWVEKLDYDSLVVSKGPAAPPGAASRPNVGFEAETWAWFFDEYYDRLPAVVACLQANPFDHIKPEMLNKTLAAIECGDLSYTPIGTPGHSGLTGIEMTDHKSHSKAPMREWWARLFKSKPVTNWYTPYGGQFAVSRETIRQRPREFYQTIREECKTKNDACCLERLWQFIFTGLP